MLKILTIPARVTVGIIRAVQKEMPEQIEFPYELRKKQQEKESYDRKKVKKTQKERVSEKYGAMVSYYAELLGLCHKAVAKNDVLSNLDPMGQKTSATTLFIRSCARMDKSDDATSAAQKLMNIGDEAANKRLHNIVRSLCNDPMCLKSFFSLVRMGFTNRKETMKPIRKDEQVYLKEYINRKFDRHRSHLESERQIDVDNSVERNLSKFKKTLNLNDMIKTVTKLSSDYIDFVDNYESRKLDKKRRLIEAGEKLQKETE